MSVDLSMHEEIVKGDYRNEVEDIYIKKLDRHTKIGRIMIYSIGALYISLLIVSLLVI